MADCCNHFSFTDDGDSFESWQGLRGPYYTPHLADDGTLTWTNNGGLPNPQPVDISGPPGSSVNLRGPVATVYDLPVTAPASELWQVGTQAPYNGYFFNGAAWVNLGPVAAGATFTPTVSSDGVISWTNDGSLPNPEPVNIKGQQGETGATPDLQIGTVETGAPGSAAEASITGTPEEPRLNLTLPQGQQGPAVPLSDATPLMDDTASAGTGTSAARADHRHPTDTSRASAAALATYVRPNLLNNWYFVGGGSQLGYGAFPINQRGQTSYTGAVYGIDRWKGTNQNANVIVSNNYLRFFGTNGNSVWLQNWSDNKTIYGKQITISMLLNNGTLLTASGTLPVSDVFSNTGFSTPADNNINFGVYKRSDGTWFAQIGNDQSGSSVVNADIIAVKVELGDTQTLAHQEGSTWVLNEIPDYETELLHCKTSTADPSDNYANGSVEFGNNIGIVQNTNTATQNITKGQYVIWKGALYTASSAIASGATLSGSNLTAVTNGGLNELAYFTPGQRYTFGFFGTAFVSDSGKSLTLSITSGKRVLGVPTIESLKVIARGVTGYVDIFNYSLPEVVGNTDFTISVTSGTNFLEVKLLKTTALTNATNNTPATVNGAITFLA